MTTDTALSCPACGRPSPELLTPLVVQVPGLRLDGRILECPACTHRFFPTTDEEQLAIEGCYDAEYSGFREDPYFLRVIDEEVRSTLLPRKPPPARVLDVGCGNGAFLDAAARAGYEVEGVDISEAAAALCRSRGHRARAVDFLSASFDEPYDMVTMWDVVEHLQHPAAFLSRARELLRPGGLLVLKIPGFGRPGFTAISWYHGLARSLLGAPRHVQYFNRVSLAALLDRLEFREKEWMEPKPFRSKPPARTLKRRVGRVVVGGIAAASGNANLYVLARRGPGEEAA